MTKGGVQFLLKLNGDIGKASKMLDVDRGTLVPALGRFIETLSIGFDLGLKQKGKSKSLLFGSESQLVKPSKQTKVRVVKGNRMPGRTAKLQAAIKSYLANGPRHYHEIVKKVHHLVADLAAPDQAVFVVLRDGGFKRDPKVRGLYHGAKVKKVAKKTVKAKAKVTKKVVAKKATNGHSKTTPVTVSASAVN